MNFKSTTLYGFKIFNRVKLSCSISKDALNQEIFKHPDLLAFPYFPNYSLRQRDRRTEQAHGTDTWNLHSIERSHGSQFK